ncbi:PPOX class F420-dependent oxidoreductase [Nocardia vulneris]|uniref:PPOX class F420-dependent oxidoreductase n=1 Tax=Nocardia vulneris TaxID=1141657 RepID=UPI0030CDBFCB
MRRCTRPGARVERVRSAALATSNADGRPQSSVIFVDHDADVLVFSTIKERLKSRNMLRDPRVSLLVLGTDTGRYAEVRGHVTLIDDPEKVLLHQMYAKYMAGATPPPEPAAERLIVRITLERVYAFPPA